MLFFFIFLIKASLAQSPSRVLQINLEYQTYLARNEYLFIHMDSQRDNDRGDLIKVTAMMKVQNQGGSDGTKFDVFEFDSSNRSIDLQNCYAQNVQALDGAICKDDCSSVASNGKMRQNDFSTPLAKKTVIIDNTRYPCSGGAIYPEILVQSSMNMEYQIQATYYYSNKILIMMIVCFGGIETMAIIVIYFKYRNLQKKLKKKSVVIYQSIKQSNYSSQRMKDNFNSGSFNNNQLITAKF